MNVNEIKTYLKKELPDFTITTGEEAGQPEKNWNSIQILRDGMEMVFDVRRIEDKKGAKQLRDYIELQWRRMGDIHSIKPKTNHTPPHFIG